MPRPWPRRSLLAAAALLALGAAAVAAVERTVGGRAVLEHPGGPLGLGERSVAVLPFEPLGHPEDAYLGDGLAERLREALGADDPTLVVSARGSAEGYRDGRASTRRIARELGVRWVVRGTLRARRAHEGAPPAVVVRLLVEPAGGATGAPRSAVVETPADDLPSLPMRLAGAVRAAMGEPAVDGARPAPPSRTEAAAVDAYLQGQGARRWGDDLSAKAARRSAEAFERAVRRAPRLVDAWLALAQSYGVRAVHLRRGDDGEPLPLDTLRARAHAAAAHVAALAPAAWQAPAALSDVRWTADAARGADVDSLLRIAWRRAPWRADLLAGVAAAEERAGRYDSAAIRRQALVARDPRDASHAAALARTLLFLHRLDAARDAADRAVALAPAVPDRRRLRVAIAVAAGDPITARALLDSGRAALPFAARAAAVAGTWELGFVLDAAQAEALVAAGPAAFGGDRAAWALASALDRGWRGDGAAARALGDSAAAAYAEQLAAPPARGAVPADVPAMRAEWHALRAVALAHAGRVLEARRAADSAAALVAAVRDPFEARYVAHQRVRVDLLVGGAAGRDSAVATLGRLLGEPYFLTPGWLRADPTFAPLRDDPRFARLAAGPLAGR